MVGFDITRGQELELRLSRDSMAERSSETSIVVWIVHTYRIHEVSH